MTGGSISGVVAACMAMIAAMPPAVAETAPPRATPQQVSQACRAAGGLEWGMATSQIAPDRSGRYGCISSHGWIACDRHGNCAGGSGEAQRLGTRPSAGIGARNPGSR